MFDILIVVCLLYLVYSQLQLQPGINLQATASHVYQALRKGVNKVRAALIKAAGRVSQ
jgi:hypothetical protein